jgi:hypothetical protein
MRKKLLVAALFATAVFGVCGCQKSEEKSDRNESKEETNNSDSDTEEDLSDLTFDPQAFARSHLTVGDKKNLTELDGITYPITDEELDELTSGYSYSNETYATIAELIAATETPVENDVWKNSVNENAKDTVWAVDKDSISSIDVFNYSDEKTMLGELIKEGYVRYNLFITKLLEDDDYVTDEEYIDYIVDKLGSPDYIIDLPDTGEALASDDEFEGLHMRFYDMIYDYGSYQICLSVDEEYFNMIDDGKVYSNYSDCSVSYSYYKRNGYLFHLENDYEDYAEDNLTVLGVDGTLSLEDFIEQEKNEVIDETTEAATEADTEEETEAEAETQDIELGEFVFTVSDFFHMGDYGMVIVGTVESESLNTGDKVVIVTDTGEMIQTEITWMEIKRKEVTEAIPGEAIGVVLDGIEENEQMDYGWEVYKLAE